MKVYVATYYRRNYGSALQAYALQSKLKELGAEPVIVKPAPPETGKTLMDKQRFYFRREAHYGLVRKIRRSIEKRLYVSRAEKIDRFINGHADIVRYEDVLEAMRGEKCVLLAGSDQIWNILNHEIDDFYLFRDIDNPRARKVSYAASIGISDITEEQKKYYARALAGFDAVSFREAHALRLLGEALENRELRQDVDPTLLHDAAFWEALLPPAGAEAPFLFVYMLRPDPGVMEIARHIAREKHLKIVYIGLYSNYYFGIRTVTDAGVEDFLHYLHNAQIVVTNSFHGTVFSLLFHKKFASVRIDSTSSRAESLLRLVGLEDRLIDSTADCAHIDCDYDYDSVDRALEAARNDSVDYLRRVLAF